MIQTKTSKIPYLKFADFNEIPFVRHGIFTRSGGVSPPPFNGLNISYSTNDSEVNIRKNRELIFHEMGSKELAFAHQIHGDDIVTVDGHVAGSQEQYRNCGNGDAMVTETPGINLVLQVADCQPVLLADPERKVVGAVHSGWRGSVLNIVGKTITAMITQYGCDPKDIRAGIGPSLGPCCAEFIHYKDEIPEKLWPYKDGHDHFDFWALTTDQLLDKGVLKENIQVSRMCTKCNSQQFFSYRKEKKTGRFAAVIGLTSEG